MIVVDASVLANALADDDDDGYTARRELRAAGEIAAPDLVDLETVSVLRKRWLRRTLTEQRFATAITHLQRLGFKRVPTLRLLLRRIGREFGLRLVTVDGRLASATGPRCPIRVLR